MITYTLADTVDASGNLTDASTFEFITLAEVKSYLQIDASTDDTLLQTMVDAVCEDMERELGQSLRGRTVTVEFDKYENYYLLPIRPVSSLTSITYFDEDESSGALFEASGDFNVYGLGNRSGNQVLEFSSGYNKLRIIYDSNGTASTVPTDIKLGIMAYLKVLYNDDRDFDGSLSKIKYPEATIRMINKYKQIDI